MRFCARFTINSLDIMIAIASLILFEWFLANDASGRVNFRFLVSIDTVWIMGTITLPYLKVNTIVFTSINQRAWFGIHFGFPSIKENRITVPFGILYSLPFLNHVQGFHQRLLGAKVKDTGRWSVTMI